MSHTLTYNLLVPSEQPLAYWSPLLFNSLRDHAFVFAAPDKPAGIGCYLLYADDDVQIYFDRLKAVWERLYEEHVPTIRMLWECVDDPFFIELHLHEIEQHEGTHAIDISIDLEGAELMSLSLKRAQKRMQRVYACIKDFYLLCAPCTGEGHWYHVVDYAPFVTFGQSLLPTLTLSPYQQTHGDYHQLYKEAWNIDCWVERTQLVPVPHQNLNAQQATWEYISL